MSEPTPEAEQVEATEEQDEEQVEPGQQPDRQGRRDDHVRSRLKATESERDVLRGRLDARDRRHVEAEAKRVLGQYGADLFRVENVEEFRDPETGDVDDEKIAAALEPIRLALEEGRPPAHHGDMGPRRIAPSKQQPSWGDFMSQRR